MCVFINTSVHWSSLSWVSSRVWCRLSANPAAAVMVRPFYWLRVASRDCRPSSECGHSLYVSGSWAVCDAYISRLHGSFGGHKSYLLWRNDFSIGCSRDRSTSFIYLFPKENYLFGFLVSWSGNGWSGVSVSSSFYIKYCRPPPS